MAESSNTPRQNGGDNAPEEATSPWPSSEDDLGTRARLLNAVRFFERNRGITALLAVMLLGALFTPQTGVQGPFFSNLLTGQVSPEAGVPLFLTMKLHASVLYEYAEYGILAAGMTLVILTGGIDLSVGSVLGVASVMFAWLHIARGAAPGVAIAGACGIGLLCGVTSGAMASGSGLRPKTATVTAVAVGAAVGLAVWLYAGGRGGAQSVALLYAVLAGTVAALILRLVLAQVAIQPFVATLAIMVAARGGAKVISGGQKVAPGAESWYHVQAGTPAFMDWMTQPPALPAGWPEALSDIAGFFRPVTVLFVVVILVMALVVKYTRFGRHLYAIGGNEEAARLSGVPVKLSKTTAYALCGVLSGLAGVCNASRTGLGNPEAGQTFELDAIAAVVIGGTSLMGGRGSMIFTLIGTLIIGYINKILSVNAVPEAYRLLAKGLIIVAAVVIQSREKAK